MWNSRVVEANSARLIPWSACAAGIATLEALSDGQIIASAARNGDALAARLRETAPAGLREVRQIGLMIGIQVRTTARPYLAALQERGILALTAGKNVVRLLPPLVISEIDLKTVGDALIEVLAEV